MIDYLNLNFGVLMVVGTAQGPTLPSWPWNLIGVADFNRDGHPDYALFNSSTGETAIDYVSGPTLIGTASGPTIPPTWLLVATADLNGDGNPDYVVYNPAPVKPQSRISPTILESTLC